MSKAPGESVNQMIIEIKGPVFKCEDDKAIFLGRLRSLAGCEGVIGKGRTLCLTLRGSIDTETARELQDICDYWNASYEVAID